MSDFHKTFLCIFIFHCTNFIYRRIKTGCPAYLRFKVSEDGYYLVLVAMNLRHNHQLSSTAISRRKVLHLDTKSGNKTVAMDTTATDDSDEVGMHVSKI